MRLVCNDVMLLRCELVLLMLVMLRIYDVVRVVMLGEGYDVGGVDVNRCGVE
jgi:hypothetical protein